MMRQWGVQYQGERSWFSYDYFVEEEGAYKGFFIGRVGVFWVKR